MVSAASWLRRGSTDIFGWVLGWKGLAGVKSSCVRPPLHASAKTWKPRIPSFLQLHESTHISRLRKRSFQSLAISALLPLFTMFQSQHMRGYFTFWHLLFSIVAAQSHSHSNSQSQSAITTSLIFGPWGIRLSVVAVDTTATTYLQDNHDPSRNNSNTKECNAEAYDRVTIINGPSTAGITYVYTECGTNLAGSYQLDCPLTDPNTATCSYVFSMVGSTGTSTVTQNSSELSPQPCTITAGIERLSAGSVTALTTPGLSTSYFTMMVQVKALLTFSRWKCNSAANNVSISNFFHQFYTEP